VVACAIILELFQPHHIPMQKKIMVLYAIGIALVFDLIWMIMFLKVISKHFFS